MALANLKGERLQVRAYDKTAEGGIQLPSLESLGTISFKVDSTKNNLAIELDYYDNDYWNGGYKRAVIDTTSIPLIHKLGPTTLLLNQFLDNQLGDSNYPKELFPYYYEITIPGITENYTASIDFDGASYREITQKFSGLMETKEDKLILYWKEKPLTNIVLSGIRYQEIL